MSRPLKCLITSFVLSLCQITASVHAQESASTAAGQPGGASVSLSEPKGFDAHVSVGLGTYTSDFTTQAKIAFTTKFAPFNPQVEVKRRAPAFQGDLDFAVLRHADHLQLDLRLGGGGIVGGEETFHGTAKSDTVTLSINGTGSLTYLYLRAGPSFEVAPGLRFWPFYQKGLTRSSGSFEDEARLIATAQRLQGQLTTATRWAKQHRTLGFRFSGRITRYVIAWLEVLHSRYGNVFPQNTAGGPINVDSTSVTGGWQVPLKF